MNFSSRDARLIRRLAHNRDIERQRRNHGRVDAHKVVGCAIVIITIALVVAMMMF